MNILNQSVQIAIILYCWQIYGYIKSIRSQITVWTFISRYFLVSETTCRYSFVSIN